MAKTFHLTVARVGENLFDGEALSLLIPGTEGMLQVLAHHEPFVSRLRTGELHVVAADETSYRFEIPTTGIVEVSANQTTVLL